VAVVEPPEHGRLAASVGDLCPCASGDASGGARRHSGARWFLAGGRRRGRKQGRRDRGQVWRDRRLGAVAGEGRVGTPLSSQIYGEAVGQGRTLPLPASVQLRLGRRSAWRKGAWPPQAKMREGASAAGGRGRAQEHPSACGGDGEQGRGEEEGVGENLCHVGSIRCSNKHYRDSIG
jgi:hypothetical protein